MFKVHTAPHSFTEQKTVDLVAPDITISYTAIKIEEGSELFIRNNYSEDELSKIKRYLIKDLKESKT